MTTRPAGGGATAVSFGRGRPVPLPDAVRAPARPEAAGAVRRDGGRDRGLRDDARLLAAVVGAMTIDLVPAAWVVAGRPSLDFLKFALCVVLGWTVNAALQIAVLHRVRARSASAPLQFVAVAAIGVAFSLAVSSRSNPYALTLGLNVVDAWGTGVHGAWTSVLVAVFLVWHHRGRQRQAEASKRLRSVQLAQLAARRGLVESQLQAVQARIDPQHFFDTLDSIERLYRSDPARAEALFDELVVFLRAALPSVHSAASVLVRELDLARTGVRLHALASAEAVDLEIDADRSLLRLAFPPGLLLPLLRGVLRTGTGARRIGLVIRLETGGARPPALVLSITAGSAPDEAALRGARDTLRSLFGTTATLVCTPPCGQRVTTRMRIDHDPC